MSGIRFIDTTTQIEDPGNPIGAFETFNIVTYYGDISNVNNPPEITDIIINLDIGNEYVFQLSDIEDNFSDVENHNFFKLNIDSLPSGGFLYLNNVLISSSILITKDDIQNGNFKYVPFIDSFGFPYDNFLIRVNDDGLPLRPFSNQGRIIFNITSPNLEPNVSSNETIIDYNDFYIFSLSDFTLNYNDPENDLFGYVEITNIDNVIYGNLKFNNIIITNASLPLQITANDLNNNLLVYEDDGLNIDYKEISFVFEVFDDN